MPKEQDLTKAELKALLLARFNAEKGKQMELQARIFVGLGRRAPEKTPEAIALECAVADVVCEELARCLKQSLKLKKFFHVDPAPSPYVFTRLAALVFVAIGKEKGDIHEDERKMLEEFLKTMFRSTFEMMGEILSPCKNIYEEYWRWVTTVLDLATERGILPTELLALQGATDEITRRMFTKEEFTTLSERAVSKLMDIDTLKKVVVQPMLDVYVGDEFGEEARREAEQALEAQVMPQLREDIRKTKVIVSVFLNEEVERIYAVA